MSDLSGRMVIMFISLEHLGRKSDKLVPAEEFSHRKCMCVSVCVYRSVVLSFPAALSHFVG